MVRSVVSLLSLAAVSCWAQTFQTIHTFPADKSEGYRPAAKLVVGPDGALYGTASEGGSTDAGTAFKITTDGAFSLLGNFVTEVTGRTPLARLMNIGDGYLYGVTANGTGTSGDPVGTVFKLDPAGGLSAIYALPSNGPGDPEDIISAEPNVLHVLANFGSGIWRVPLDGSAKTFLKFDTNVTGSAPQRIIRGSDGLIYGVIKGTGGFDQSPTSGTIFKINPDLAGLTTIHVCEFEKGVAPRGGLVESEPGVFYGTMSDGGPNSGDDGVIFKITSGGVYTVIHNTKDNTSLDDLLLASDGKLYGVSTNGGDFLYGSVFRMNTDGSGYQVIHTFNNTNGAYPVGGLVQAGDGNLYGVTSEGNAADAGTIFRIGLDLPPAQVNHRPIATPDAVESTGNALVIDVLANDYDVDEGDTLAVSIDEDPANGTVFVQPNGTILYTPNVAQPVPDSFEYTITDHDGLSATATVTMTIGAPPQPWQPGAYNGLLNLDPSLEGATETPRGQLLINVSARGIITGKLLTQNKPLTVRGIFADDGTAIAVVKISKKKKALLFLGAGERGSLTAVYFGNEIWSGSVDPFLYVAGNEGTTRFTVDLGSDSNSGGTLPLGRGFAIGRAYPSGAIAMVGKLCDGTPISWGTFGTNSDSQSAVTVFNAPVKGGYCAGKFIVGGGSSIQGTLKWLRPPATKVNQPYQNGFHGGVDASLNFYTPPARTANVFGVSDGAVGELKLHTGQVILGPGAVTLHGPRFTFAPPIKSLSINRSNGLFSGKMLIDSKPIRFQGVVHQGLQGGSGYFTKDNQSGNVYLTFD